MRAEAASNAYILSVETALTTEDYLSMAQLGWQVPTGAPKGTSERQVLDLTGDRSRLTNAGPVEAPDPDGSRNFFVDMASPVDFRSLSELAVRTFREVYDVHHPGELQYKAFNRNSIHIRFPTLRVKRAET